MTFCKGRHRILKIGKNSVKDSLLFHFGGQKTLYVLHHEGRRLMSRDDSQIFTIKEMAMISFVLLNPLLANDPRSTDERVRLTRWPSDEHPAARSPKRMADSLIDLLIRIL